MPNWCYSKTTIVLKDFDKDNSADVDFMSSVENAVRSSTLLMLLCPIDENIIHPSVAWGTKWDICFADICKTSDGRLVITYRTAWSPCLKAFETAVSTNPRLEFTTQFSEFGMMFAGEHMIASDQHSYVEIDLQPLGEHINEGLNNPEFESISHVVENYVESLECSETLKEYLIDCPLDF